MASTSAAKRSGRKEPPARDAQAERLADPGAPGGQRARLRPARDRRDRAARGDRAAAARATAPAALLRHREAPPQGNRSARRCRAGLPRRPLRLLCGLPDGAAADPGADDVPAPARLHGRHPRRRLRARPGELRRVARGDRQRQPLRPARLEPAAQFRRARRADGDLRRLHRRPDHPDRPSVRARGDAALVGGRRAAAGAPARRNGVLHGRARRDGTRPAREPRLDARVRDDRGGARDRALGPRGLWADPRRDHVLLAIGLLLAKALGICLVIVAIESSFAKLRLYKIPEFTVASFLLAVLAVITFVFQREFGGHLTVFGAFASVVAVVMLLLEFGMLRSQDVWEQLGLYGFGSAAVAALAFAAASTTNGGSDLFVLGAVTIAFKALVIPLAVGFILRTLDVDLRLPSRLRAPSAVLLGIVLSSFAFLALTGLKLQAPGSLPLAALPIAVAAVLVALLLMVVRPYAVSELIGFLALENGVTLASLVIAPSMPLILALLLLFDVFVGLLVFVVLVQYLGLQRATITTDILQRLRG